jgi:hypothetical protein
MKNALANSAMSTLFDCLNLQNIFWVFHFLTFQKISKNIVFGAEGANNTKFTN